MTGELNRSRWGLCGARNASARPCGNALDFGVVLYTCADDGCLLDYLGGTAVAEWRHQDLAAENVPRQRSKRPRP